MKTTSEEVDGIRRDYIVRDRHGNVPNPGVELYGRRHRSLGRLESGRHWGTFDGGNGVKSSSMDCHTLHETPS